MTLPPLLPADAVPPPGSPAEADALPTFAPEGLARTRSGAGSHPDEPLVELAAAGVDARHSYVHAGWTHAIDRQWLRAELVTRLQRASAALPPGFGLAVFDGWRPLALQRELHEALAADLDAAGPAFVAPPSEDPAAPPPHLTGGAVDLTLTWDGAPLALGTGFDEFTDLAATAAFEPVPGPVRALRRLLYHRLHEQGLVVLAEEWWHFEYGTRLWSAITGQPVRYGPTAP